MNWQKIADKFLSGRFIVTILLAISYCVMPFVLAYLVLKGKIEAAFFTGYLTGFCQSFLLVAKFYFERLDRPNENNGQPK